MANASGSVFAKDGVADAVNLTFVPLPGGGAWLEVRKEKFRCELSRQGVNVNTSLVGVRPRT